MIGGITFTFAAIFLGAALLASVALYTRQPIIIAYIALGAILGPYGSGLIDDIEIVVDAGHVGIIFLLFLLGLDMQPRALLSSLKQSSLVAVVSSAVFAGSGFGIAWAFGFSLIDCTIIGAALMFSSTIIGIKLLPTTVLHHRHLGEVLVALLLFQDLLAIIILVLIQSSVGGETNAWSLVKPLLALPVLGFFCWGLVKTVLLPLITRFDRYHEYIFLLSIGWCLGIAELAIVMGLSAEIGAFMAGVAIATSPISQYIAVSLKPLRDFFLVIFFFSVGAQFDLATLPEVALAATTLAVVMLGLKPLVYHALLRGVSESHGLAWNLGFRLGQCSEFALLIGFVAIGSGLLSGEAAVLIQATTILTLLASSYIVVLNFPTPIAISERLRRD
ncbi:sodium/hydrogen antiporter [Luminiphilus syltensis NOR5-1B]|uniref:Sodium/hydrogen antiporter n=1 Tax=Luminiphilus syltensis NOR5-1B TaxID=565045 RepID=B8KQX9_9GAMM|nr:cation:proton antiporter [Luminiphilus syltensis]EED36471.1 sodium/hydrogen antiporter [Luminiphilus syltensis NOR5-1B]